MAVLASSRTINVAFPFFVGLHQPADARHFALVCISINRLWKRRKRVGNRRTLVFVDSGAFTVIAKHGRYLQTVTAYAQRLFDLHTSGVVTIAGAAAQDYMCEAFILAKTGLTVRDHQRLTIERYDALVAELMRLFGVDKVEDLPFPVVPVLQGWTPADYARHVRDYGARLGRGMWVGVGSVCKRNGKASDVRKVLQAIKEVRPDLRLHGFGLKTTALKDPVVRMQLATADSMAWSFAARKQGRNANDWREARRFARAVRRPANDNDLGPLFSGLAA